MYTPSQIQRRIILLLSCFIITSQIQVRNYSILQALDLKFLTLKLLKFGIFLMVNGLKWKFMNLKFKYYISSFSP